MLSDKVFNHGMRLLSENYEKVVSSAIREIWREYLDEHLSDDEFAIAVKHAILHSRFMPTAADLVQHIQGDNEAKAVQEWQDVIKAAAQQDQNAIAYLSTRAIIALRAIGGLNAVGFADEYQMPRLEKNFIKVYCQCSDKDALVLPQANVERSARSQNHEATPMPDHIKQQMQELKSKFSMNGKRS